MGRLIGKLSLHNRQTDLSALSGTTFHPDPSEDELQLDKAEIKETELHGLFQLWPVPNAQGHAESKDLDIVAVHGLNGDAYRTWTEKGKLWLRDFLPQSIPQARIFTYGYNSGIAFTGSASRVEDYARALIERLRARRRYSNDKRPIIFICHSLGGIVVKKALVVAHERSDRYSSISRNTVGIVFLGTPHQGSDLAFWGHCLGTIADVFLLGSLRTQLLSDLQPKSECLGAICSQFVERGQGLRIFSVYERLKMKGLAKLVVEKASAVMNLPNEVPIPIEADHRSMCWFSDPDSQKFRLILDCLEELVEDSLQVPKAELSILKTDFLRTLQVQDPESSLRGMDRPALGTCEWILETSEYQNWRNNPQSKVLWVWGSPGSGKTTMLRHLVETLRKSLQREDSFKDVRSTVVFSFPGPSRQSLPGEEELLRDLIYQILLQNEICIRYLTDKDLERYIYRKVDVTPLLWSMLSTILQRTKNSNFWIVLDGIDEFQNPMKRNILAQIGKLLNEDLGDKCKVLITDRTKYTGHDLGPKVTAVHLQERTALSNDVRRFIAAHVSELCVQGLIPWQYQVQIEDALMDASEGNFLQAKLAWTNFSSATTYWSPQVIKSRLEMTRKITKEAEAYYCSLLKLIPEDSRAIARSGFTWVIGARKLLTLSELQHAVAISAGQSSWSDLHEALGFNFEAHFDQAFGYLLQVDHNKQVRFVHQTVKDLLTSSPPAIDFERSEVLSRFHIASHDIDAELAKACIVVLSFEDFKRLRDIALDAFSQQMQNELTVLSRTKIDPTKVVFAEYNGGIQVDSLKDKQPTKGLQRTLSQKSLNQSGHTLLSYCIAYWNYHCAEGGTNADVVQSLSHFVLLRQSHFFHLVAMRSGVARIHRGFFWSKINQFARFPALCFLMRIGDHPTVLQNLMSRGQKINTLDCNGFNALIWAALEERMASLEVMLAESDISFSKSRPRSEPVLHICCRAEVSLKVLKRLLEDPRVDVNASGLDGQTALSLLISKEKNQELAKNLLTRKDLDINATNRNGLNYLDQVFYEGRLEALAEAIIDRHDIPMNWYEKLPGHPKNRLSDSLKQPTYLERAGYLGWHKIENKILEHQPAEALLVGQSGQNILERYAYHGLENRLAEILDRLPQTLFLDKGYSIGQRLMFLCAQQDWPSIVLKLKHDFALSNSEKDEKGRTLIHWAADLHWDSIQLFLRGKSAEWLDEHDGEGRSALHLAAENRNEIACKALLEGGASWRLRDKHGRLPAHIAAENGHRNVLLYLLQYPIKLTDHDADKRQLLHFVVMWHSESFLRQCLKLLSLKLDVFDKRRRTPLHYAAIYGNSGALRALLDAGSNPDLRDASNFTALHYALIDGSVESVRALLDAGADVSALDRFGRSSLQLAVLSESLAVVNLMIKRLSKDDQRLKELVHHKDSFDRTVLHSMAGWGVGSKDEEDEIDEEEAFLLELELDDMVINRRSTLGVATVKRYVSLILSLYLKPEGQDYLGQTPLHLAVQATSLTFVDAFLASVSVKQAKKCVQLKDWRSCTALDYAVNDGNEAIATRLSSAGAVHSVDWQMKIRPLYGSWEEVQKSKEERDLEEREKEAEREGLSLSLDKIPGLNEY